MLTADEPVYNSVHMGSGIKDGTGHSMATVNSHGTWAVMLKHIKDLGWTTKGECCAGGGVQVNNARITSEDHELQQNDLIEGRLLLLAAGKKNKLLVRIE